MCFANYSRHLWLLRWFFAVLYDGKLIKCISINRWVDRFCIKNNLLILTLNSWQEICISHPAVFSVRITNLDYYCLFLNTFDPPRANFRLRPGRARLPRIQWNVRRTWLEALNTCCTFPVYAREDGDFIFTALE